MEPIGAGRTIDATMVAAKMARSCQSAGVIPAGVPARSIAAATAKTTAQRQPVRGVFT
jgi:hypothetical protein